MRKKRLQGKARSQEKAGPTRISVPDWFPGPRLSLDPDAAEMARFLDLGLGPPFRLVKPSQTLRLYGISQRLTVPILRDAIARGERETPKPGSPEHRFITDIPGISVEDAAFLKGVIRTVLDGERDAYKAFDLALPKVRRKGIEAALICACYALAQSLWPERQHRKAVRQWVAELWAITPPRVSQCKKAHGREITEWIGQAVRLAAAAKVTRELVLAQLLDSVLTELTSPTHYYLQSGTKVGLANWPPEHLFDVEFPAPLPSMELAIKIGSR